MSICFYLAQDVPLHLSITHGSTTYNLYPALSTDQYILINIASVIHDYKEFM